MTDVPYTISFVIRKRVQLDGFNELPKDKRPTDEMIWNGTSEEIDIWMDKVFKNKKENKAELIIEDYEIEG